MRKWCSVSDFVARATRPAEEIFFIYSLDNVAATAANELSRFVKQGFGTNEFKPKGHGWGFSFAAFCPTAAEKRLVVRASLAKAWASKDFLKDVLLTLGNGR